MSAETTATATRVPMSWEDYLHLPGDLRGEYLDGALVTAPAPGRRHQEICFRLISLLKAAAAPGENVTGGWGWQPPTLPQGEFVPDVMVFPDTDDEVRFRGVPALAVEVLSSNRGDDLVVKPTKYARHGLLDLWVVDPAHGVVLTYRLVEGAYALTGEHSRGTVALSCGERSVDVDLDALLA